MEPVNPHDQSEQKAPPSHDAAHKIPLREAGGPAGPHIDVAAADQRADEIFQPVVASDKESEALDNYRNRLKGTGINRMLRGDTSLVEKAFGAPKIAMDSIRGLDSFLEKSKVEDDVTVSRGFKLPINPEKALRPGEIFRDAGFVSTSLARDVGESFSTVAGDYAPIMMDIHIPKGSSAFRMPRAQEGDYAESEVLLPRGAGFLVDSIEYVGNKYRVKASYVGSEKASLDDLEGGAVGRVKRWFGGEREQDDVPHMRDGGEIERAFRERYGNPNEQQFGKKEDATQPVLAEPGEYYVPASEAKKPEVQPVLEAINAGKSSRPKQDAESSSVLWGLMAKLSALQKKMMKPARVAAAAATFWGAMTNPVDLMRQSHEDPRQAIQQAIKQAEGYLSTRREEDVKPRAQARGPVGRQEGGSVSGDASASSNLVAAISRIAKSATVGLGIWSAALSPMSEMGGEFKPRGSQPVQAVPPAADFGANLGKGLTQFRKKGWEDEKVEKVREDFSAVGKKEGGVIEPRVGEAGHDSEPIQAEPDGFIVRAQEAQKPENRSALDAITRGQVPRMDQGGVVGFTKLENEIRDAEKKLAWDPDADFSRPSHVAEAEREQLQRQLADLRARREAMYREKYFPHERPTGPVPEAVPEATWFGIPVAEHAPPEPRPARDTAPRGTAAESRRKPDDSYADALWEAHQEASAPPRPSPASVPTGTPARQPRGEPAGEKRPGWLDDLEELMDDKASRAWKRDQQHPLFAPAYRAAKWAEGRGLLPKGIVPDIDLSGVARHKDNQRGGADSEQGADLAEAMRELAKELKELRREVKESRDKKETARGAGEHQPTGGARRTTVKPGQQQGSAAPRTAPNQAEQRGSGAGDIAKVLQMVEMFGS